MSCTICLLIVASSIAFKSLFFFSYHSTDFEVHRNWLAITHNAEVKDWYIENTSQWTLDYPPFFAAFEWILSKIACLIDPRMLILSKEAYVSNELIVFQRCSVIISELLFLFAVHKLVHIIFEKQVDRETRLHLICLGLFSFNFGLFVIDHIHFQYNGFLFGVLFMSIICIFQGNFLLSGFWFAVLLNLKHLFVCLAPIYFIFILLHYCTESVDESYKFRFDRLLGIGFTVIGVFMTSLGPFIYMGNFQQLIERLFPFQRGLTHAYWAPNVWALYNFADKALSISDSFDRFCSSKSESVIESRVNMTSGLTGNYVYTCLPIVYPYHTAILSAIFALPSLVICKRDQKAVQVDAGFIFLRAIVGAAWATFLFGWHVHEKAIMTVTLPLLFLAVISRKLRGLAFYTTTIAHFSLLPLIFTPNEQPAMLSALVAFTTAQYTLLGRMSPPVYSGLLGRCWPLLRVLASIHLVGLLPLLAVTRILLPLQFPAYPFLPLMLTSVYTAVGICAAFVVYSWINLVWMKRPDQNVAPEEEAGEEDYCESVRLMKKNN